jgi:hypothetical protein
VEEVKAITALHPHAHTIRKNFMPPCRPSKSACHELSTQERFNERKSEEKQVERLLAVPAKRLGQSGVQGTSSSARVA